MGPTIHRKGKGLFLLASLACGIVAGSFGPAVAQDAESGGLSGLVLDPAGRPAEGFRLVFVDDAGAEYISKASDELGRYVLSVPPGSDYRLVAALAPDGTRVDVPPLPPIPVEAGMRRLDVKVQYPATAPKAPGGTKVGDLPWVQIGIAGAAVILFAVTVWDDDDEQRASPSLPPSR